MFANRIAESFIDSADIIDYACFNDKTEAADGRPACKSEAQFEAPIPSGIVPVLTPNVVTIWYRAPELLLGANRYGPAIDIWATGCVFGELLLHRPLMAGSDEASQIVEICKLLGTPKEAIWPSLTSYPNYLKMLPFPNNPYNNLEERFPTATKHTLDLLNRLLAFDPQKRITALQALEHPYFNERPTAINPRLMPTWREHRNDPKHTQALSCTKKQNSPPLQSQTKRTLPVLSHLSTGPKITSGSDSVRLTMGGGDLNIERARSILKHAKRRSHSHHLTHALKHARHRSTNDESDKRRESVFE
eukprot:GHVN01075471.1.p1 GENE.GHVN01075471.1~~GHVN01075471.1.p1  ORF type:complete len:304 (-),score=69.01 GHVN01075471.1:127-1038(-)